MQPYKANEEILNTENNESVLNYSDMPHFDPPETPEDVKWQTRIEEGLKANTPDAIPKLKELLADLTFLKEQMINKQTQIAFGSKL